MNTEAVKIEYYQKWLSITREIVLKNIDTDKYAAFLYGSMVRDPLNAYDMDIGFLGETDLPGGVKKRIIEDLEESIVPFRFDLVDFRKTSEEFRKFAIGDITIWNKPNYIKLR